MRQLQTLATLLDARWRIPGTSIRFGWDTVLGLLPGIGDTITTVLSSWILYQAHQMGVPLYLKLKMAKNIFIDWLVGLIPLVGDIFDIGWKANMRNSTLLLHYIEEQQEIVYDPRPSDRR